MKDKGSSHADKLEQTLRTLEAGKKVNTKKASSMKPEMERLAILNEKLEALPQHEHRQVLGAMGLERVSDAPKPITPLPNKPMALPPLPAPPPPNWGKWSRMLDVELWQAVALTLNFEPEELPVYLGAYEQLGDNPFKICPQDFLERLEIANSQGGVALPLKPVHALKARCLVDLLTFGAWAANVWKDLPQDFPGVANKSPADDSARRDFLSWMNSDHQDSPEYQAQYAKAWESLVTADDIEKAIVECEATPASDWGQRERKEHTISALKAKRVAILASVLPSEAEQHATEPHPGPEVAPETTDQRCTRLLLWLEEEKGRGERGALARVVKRDGRARQTVTADIERAKKQKKETFNPMSMMVRKITF